MFVPKSLTRRVAGMSEEEFFEHYRTTHHDLAARIPGLISYQQSALRHDSWKDSSDEYAGHDALSTYTFESRKAAVMTYASREDTLLGEDARKFIDHNGVVTICSDVVQRFDGEWM